MRKIALNYYACPECKKYPLTLSEKRVEVVFDNYTHSLNSASIAELLGKDVSKKDELLNVHVKSGYLLCLGCDKAYEIKEYIPHLRADESLPLTGKDAPVLTGDTERITKSLPEGKKKDSQMHAAVKALLPFDRAKKEKAQKNLEHDLEYRTKHSEKNKYVRLFEKYLEKPPRVVLEIGIGQGGFTSSVKKMLNPSIFFGLDYERDWLDIAKIRDFETECVVADARNLPFRDDAFDLMYSAYTLEHIPGLEAVVSETRRTSKEAFYIFGPSSWSPFDFHFEKAPFLPWLPAGLGKKWAYYWKVTRAGFSYSRKEISDEYDMMNYMTPSYFERTCKANNLEITPLLSRFLHYSFNNAYQYHPVMKLIAKFEFIVVPLVSLIESLKVQPIMVYFLKRKNN